MNKRSVEQWQVLFAEHVASGLSARQYCLQRGLCPKHFCLRRQQLSQQTRTTAFVPVRRERPVAVEPSVPVVLRHGRSTVELHAVSPEWLSQLLVALA